MASGPCNTKSKNANSSLNFKNDPVEKEEKTKERVRRCVRKSHKSALVWSSPARQSALSIVCVFVCSPLKRLSVVCRINDVWLCV